MSRRTPNYLRQAATERSARRRAEAEENRAGIAKIEARNAANSAKLADPARPASPELPICSKCGYRGWYPSCDEDGNEGLEKYCDEPGCPHAERRKQSDKENLSRSEIRVIRPEHGMTLCSCCQAPAVCHVVFGIRFDEKLGSSTRIALCFDCRTITLQCLGSFPTVPR